jgi:CheY-like chemotaxis protein
MTTTWSILFVDDDGDFLQAQAAYFGSRGHTVVTASSSAEAMEALEAATPDIIFLDLMMERFDSGFRLGYEMRKRERLHATPIVMLSGVAAATGQRFDDEMDGMRAWSRLDRFIDKPVTGKQLLGVAEELLAGPGGTSGEVDAHPGTSGPAGASSGAELRPGTSGPAGSAETSSEAKPTR